MNKNILIAYYSWSGSTRKIAEKIHNLTGGTLFEILPEKPYPSDYNACVRQAKSEINESYQPALSEVFSNIEAHDLIFIGSPNWWSTIAPPVAAFLNNTNLSGKVIASFHSHGGGGAGRIEKDIARLCPHSVMRDGISIYGSGSRELETEIAAWMQRVIDQ